MFNKYFIGWKCLAESNKKELLIIKEKTTAILITPAILVYNFYRHQFFTRPIQITRNTKFFLNKKESDLVDSFTLNASNFAVSKETIDDIYKKYTSKYPNLLSSELIKVFKSYRNYTKNKGKERNPTVGTKCVRNDFKNWVSQNYKDYEFLLQKVDDIIAKQELTRFIIDLIESTKFSQLKIVRVINELGLIITHETIRRIGKEKVFKNKDEDYKSRFSKGSYKWRDLDWREDGNPRTYQEAVKNAVDYIKKNVLTDEIKKRFKLKDSIAPSIPQIREVDSEFTGAFTSRGISIYDINNELGLEAKIELNKWQDLDWGKDGNPRTYQEAIKNAVKYLNEEILTESYKEKYKDHKRETIRKAGHYDFIRALQERHIEYNDFLKSADLETYRNQFKWRDLDWGKDGNPRTYQEAVKNAAKYLKEEILTREFKVKHNLKEGIAPPTQLLMKTDNDFASAIGYRKISYIDIRKEARLKRAPIYPKEYYREYPIVANLDNLRNHPRLLNHLKYIKKQGTFPDDIIDNFDKFPRVSDFEGTIAHIPHEAKYDFIEKLIKEKKIKVVLYKNCKTYDSICNLLELSQDKYYTKKDFINPLTKRRYGHGSVCHDSLLIFIMKKDKNSVGAEIPIWESHGNIYLTGHIDLIQVNTPYVDIIDYKPDQTPILSNVVYTSFINSIPQVSFYGLVVKRNFGIEKLRCITFNKKGAWIYDPIKLLVAIRDLLLKYKRPCSWNPYL